MTDDNTNIYLYHYHAIKKLDDGSVAEMDGLIHRKVPLSGDWDEYPKLKDDIESVNGEQVTGETHYLFTHTVEQQRLR